MKKINKLLSLILSAVFISALFFPCTTVLGADTVRISTAEDFLEFARNCKRDAWSENKKAELTCDIDFAKTEFKCVPTFSGCFDGNGYAIKNVNGIVYFINRGNFDLNNNRKTPVPVNIIGITNKNLYGK